MGISPSISSKSSVLSPCGLDGELQAHLAAALLELCLCDQFKSSTKAADWMTGCKQSEVEVESPQCEWRDTFRLAMTVQVHPVTHRGLGLILVLRNIS